MWSNNQYINQSNPNCQCNNGNIRGGSNSVVHLQQKCNELEAMVQQYKETVHVLNCALVHAKNENTELREHLHKIDNGTSRGHEQGRLAQSSTTRKIPNSIGNPLEICPPEIWEKILDYITDSTDLTNLLNVSVTLGDILAPRKSTFLFAQILPILVKYMKRSEIIKCRLVCHEWKSRMDNFLQNHSSHFRVSSLWNYEIDLEMHWLKHLYQFGKPVDVDRFLRHMQPISLNNPFITRSIYVEDDYSCVHKCDVFWTRLSDLLKVFGEHVWYCNFVIDSPSLQTFRYGKLHACLGLMPNLKTLWIYSSHLIQVQMRGSAEVVSVREWDHRRKRL